MMRLFVGVAVLIWLGAGAFNATAGDVGMTATPVPTVQVQVSRNSAADSAAAGAAAVSDTSLARWDADIAAFEAADRKAPPVPGGVLFVGSSSIRMWTDVQNYFPGVHLLNRGFGGSEISDVIHYANRIVIPYQPRLVVFYAGDNDLAAGKTAERVLADYRLFVAVVRAKLPDVPIAFISIKPSLARWNLADVMRRANDLVRKFSAGDDHLQYVDVFTPMLGDDGTPRKDIFLEDGLHMNAKGYAIWRKALGGVVEPAPTRSPGR